MSRFVGLLRHLNQYRAIAQSLSETVLRLWTRFTANGNGPPLSRYVRWSIFCQESLQKNTAEQADG